MYALCGDVCVVLVEQMTAVTVTNTITACCWLLTECILLLPLPFLSFAHLLDCCCCCCCCCCCYYYFSIRGCMPRKRTRPLDRKTISTNTHTHTHAYTKRQCICLPVHRIVWTDGGIDEIDARGEYKRTKKRTTIIICSDTSRKQWSTG